MEILRDYLSLALQNETLVEMLLPHNEKGFAPFSTNIIQDTELAALGLYYKTKPCSGEECKFSNRKPNPDWYKDLLVDPKQEGLSSLGDFGGSNNWVISGNHTKSGEAIFSNDPHLGNGIPSKWHLSSFTRSPGTLNE